MNGNATGPAPKMRALLTGATGFLGAAVLRVLVADGHAVRALVRPGANRANLGGLPADALEIVEGDLVDRPSLRRALAGCDALFHVAASYRLWARDPETEIFRPNVDGTRALMEEALEAGSVRRIVYTSSVAVLAPPKTKDGSPAADEGSEPDSIESVIGPYKRSKYLAEKVVRDLSERRGLPAVIVLPSTPIGPRDVKPTPTGKIVLDFLNGKMPAYVDTGLNLVDVDDCARGHLLAFERGKVGERYILGNENLTLREILLLLAAATGLRAPRIRVPYAVAWAAGAASTAFGRLLGREPGIVLDAVRMSRKKMYFNPAKAFAELGLGHTPAREALRKAALWFAENGYVRPDVAERILPRLA